MFLQYYLFYLGYDIKNDNGRWKQFDSTRCSPETPCFLDEGDCDSDHDCYGVLRCGVNNCIKNEKNSWNWWDDCCTSTHHLLFIAIN